MVVRASRPQDLEALRAFVHRCSPDTIYRRFHGAGPRAIERELGRIAASVDEHRSWVAVGDGEVRGTATLARSRTGSAEMALWVEDAWFRRGIGRSLVAALRAQARERGLDAMVAWVQADNDRALRFIRAVAPGSVVRFVGGPDLEVRIPVGIDGSQPTDADAGREAA